MADGVKVGEAYVEVHPDTKAFATELDTQVEGIGKSASAKLGSLIAVGAFAAGTTKAIDAAKKLEEAVGGTSAVFKQNSDQIDSFAKSAAKSLGLSESAARELTTQIGSALKGYGYSLDEATSKSQELTKLGADLAATYGGDTREAVEALSAALRGEFDPLERYGVAINQTLIDQKAVALGLANSTSNVDQHARAQAALALIMERSADAQGQFGREAGTASGASKIAAAEAEDSAAKLGQNLLPVYTKAAELAGTMAEKFGVLPPVLQTVVLGLVGITALAGPLGTVKDRVTGVATAIHSGDFGQSKLAAAGTVVAGLAVAYGLWADSINEAKKASEELVKAGLGEDLKGGSDAIDARIGRLRGQISAINSEINNVADEGFGRVFDVDYVKQLEEGRAAIVEQIRQLDTLRDQAETLAEATDGNTEAAAKWLGEQLLLGKAFASTEEALKAYTEQETKAESSTEKVKEQTKLNAEAHKNLADRVNDAYDAYQSIIGTSLDYTDAQREVQVKISELNDLYRSGTANANDYAAKQEELLKASDAQAKAAVDEAEAQATLEGKVLSARDKAKIYADELDKLAQKYPAIAGQLAQFKDQLDKIPNTKTVDLELRVKDLTQGLLAGLKGPNPLASIPLLGGLTARAGGGPVDAGKPYLVGEKGPELMVPGRSGTVVPNAGVNLTQNIFGGGLNANEVAEVVAQRTAITLVGAA